MENSPPPLQKNQSGEINIESLASTVEWFLSYDERVAAMRHPSVDAIYQWRQQDANSNGAEMAPFPRAEDRFAIGIFQAIAENDSEPSLKQWMSEILTAMQESKELAGQIAGDYKFSLEANSTPIEEANLLPTNGEKRMYLSARWFEILCTAELRVLGWIYQELYGKPFAP
ncbi:MAG: hypothetical protein ABI954_13050 [Pyrinomonadaceae bacterium]